MNKKYIKLIIGIIFVLVLFIVYLLLVSGENNSDKKEENTSENSVKITDIQKENVKCVVLKTKNSIIQIIPKNSEKNQWTIKELENVELNQSNIDSFIENMISISAEEIINADKNFSQYGLDSQEKALIIYSEDGKENVIYLGTATPDNNYYYAKKSDSDTVYMIDSINGKRFGYTINDFADKTIPKVSPYKLLDLNIKRKGKLEIDLEYTQEKEGNAKNLIDIGMETMKMNKPYYGLAVYPTNLQDNVLINITDIQLGDIAEASLKHLDKFGIDEPEVEISLSDGENSLKLTVGKKADDKNYYCIVDNKKCIFLIDEKYITPFIEADPIKFVEKFVSLQYRADVEKVEIKGKGKSYNVTFGEEVKEENQNSKNTRFNDNRKTYINNKEVDKDTFAEFFELLAGITFDSIDENADTSGEADIIIKYTLKDGSIKETKFVPFNDSFYTADGDTKGMIISRQNVIRVLDKAESIIN